MMNNSQGNQGSKTSEFCSSSCEQILFEVPQGLGLRPVSFNIFLSDHFSSFLDFTFFFLILNDIDYVSYADDSTLYNACDNVDAVVETSRMSAEKLFKWFKWFS